MPTMACTAVAVQKRQTGQPVRPPPGRFDVGGQRLATPPIRGRAGELKVIDALVTAVAHGHGGVLVIEGPPGIGKSRLLTALMGRAHMGGGGTLLGGASRD